MKHKTTKATLSSPIHSSRLNAIAAALALFLALPPTQASAQESLVSIHIARQSLGTALIQLAHQTSLELMYPPDLVAGLSAAPLSGTMSPDEALSRLLADTPLDFQRQGNTVSLLKRAPAITKLDEVRVHSQRQPTTEGTGSYTSRITGIASKTDLAFRDIPQSVSVVTRQQLDDQNINDVTEALMHVPGLTYNGVDFYSRGFAITGMQIDGGAPLALGAYNYSPQQDMAFYDRVEVMRGASGLLGGVGDPGGIINLVRKKPLAHPQFLTALSVGRWQNYRGELDASSPLGFDGRLRGRAIITYKNSDSYVNNRSTEQPALYGVLEADVTPDTTVTLGGSYSKTDNKGAPPTLPRYSNGEDLGLPRSANLSQPWAYDNTERSEVFAQLEHHFDNDWRLKLNATHTEQTVDRIYNYTSGSVDPVTLKGLTWGAGTAKTSNKQDLFDANLSGNFDLLGREHEFVLGLDWQRVRSAWTNSNLAINYTVPVDPFNPGAWNPSLSPADHNYSARYDPWGQEQLGGYGLLRLRPTDSLQVVLGARVSRYKFSQDIRTKRGQADWQDFQGVGVTESTEITPYGGLIYDLSDNWSSYLSYSEIYKPQALSLAGPPPGTPLAPITGHNYEAGVKGELFEGRLNTTFSVFHVERKGTAVQDVNYASNTSAYDGACCFLPLGKVRSQGFDLELSGEVLPGWQLAAGYTFNTTKDKTSGNPYSSLTPKHIFKLYTSYKLPGQLNRWTVGGGVQMQSKHYVTGLARGADGNFADYHFKQSGYTVVNAMVQYDIDPHWKLALNVNNLTDKTYYQQVGTLNGNNVYGTPRNWMLTLRGSF
nr:TonB-dependent siderophore receptor [Alcaligenes faecalis]